MSKSTRRRWQFDLKPTQTENQALKDLPLPFGYDAHFDVNHEELSSAVALEKEIAAKQRQVMSIAYSPGKNLLMTGFMLWMSGSSIQIFSIMMTGMALVNPIIAVTNIGQTFSKFEGEGVNLLMPKAIFLALQGLAVGVALYKCSTMGLLPVTSADWTSYLPTQTFLERCGIPL
eukprot:gene4639-9207_t